MDRNQNAFCHFVHVALLRKWPMADCYLREREGGGNGSKNGGRSHEEEKKRKEG